MSRDRILARVRAALRAVSGHHPERPAPPAPPGDASPGDPVVLLRDRCLALGVRWHDVADLAALARTTATLAPPGGVVWVPERMAGPLDPDRTAAAIESLGVRVVRRPERAEAAEVAVGLTGVDLAVAESGSLLALARAGGGRLPSVLPPIHVAVVERRAVVASLGDGLRWVAHQLASEETSAAWLISGPSRTGDIEGRLVVGVHGPGELHVVLWN